MAQLHVNNSFVQKIIYGIKWRERKLFVINNYQGTHLFPFRWLCFAERIVGGELSEWACGGASGGLTVIIPVYVPPHSDQ